MKFKSFSNIICSLIIGISIIVSCVILREYQDKPTLDEAKTIENSYKPLMTIAEAAEYLNITEDQVKTIISTEARMLQATGSYTGMMFPIIKIGKDIYVSTDSLGEWLKESSQQRKQY